MIQPEILDVDVMLVDKAISLWRSGEVVAIPTETVYGLAADACNGEAVARIYSLKSRPQFNPLIVHVANAEIAKTYGEWNPLADALAKAFWPGPITLVLKRRGDCTISELVSAGGDTIAIRVPAHPVTLQLLQAWGGGIAAPSANRSGRVSPTTAQHVRDEFGDDLSLIIDGGACDIGIESTVIDCTGDTPVILRPGAITRAMVEGVVSCQSSVVSKKEGDIMRSPGQLASHYAPSIPVRLNVTQMRAGEALLAFGASELADAERMMNLSPTGNLLEAAANLFAYLRALDNAKFTGIAVMPIPNIGIGEAINDRLSRASIEK